MRGPGADAAPMRQVGLVADSEGKVIKASAERANTSADASRWLYRPTKNPR